MPSRSRLVRALVVAAVLMNVFRVGLASGLDCAADIVSLQLETTTLDKKPTAPRAGSESATLQYGVGDAGRVVTLRRGAEQESFFQ